MVRLHKVVKFLFVHNHFVCLCVCVCACACANELALLYILFEVNVTGLFYFSNASNCPHTYIHTHIHPPIHTSTHTHILQTPSYSHCPSPPLPKDRKVLIRDFSMQNETAEDADEIPLPTDGEYVSTLGEAGTASGAASATPTIHKNEVRQAAVHRGMPSIGESDGFDGQQDIDVDQFDYQTGQGQASDYGRDEQQDEHASAAAAAHLEGFEGYEATDDAYDLEAETGNWVFGGYDIDGNFIGYDYDDQGNYVGGEYDAEGNFVGEGYDATQIGNPEDVEVCVYEEGRGIRFG